MPADAQEAMVKVVTFERRVAELQKMLQEKSQISTDSQEQMKRGFEETIQLCETLVSEKEMVVAERDYLKQELNILMGWTENLKKEKAALLQEMEEFNSLEEESKREYEKELLNEMSSLKKAVEASGCKSQELEANLVAMSEELKKKDNWAEELQRSSDIDLVQQVKQLRHTLDDAEGLSRDTRKEWAHLRSESISLKEGDVTLTAGYERMEAEGNGLSYQLETDLQRELQGAFEENTKLTTLLDGNAPKNLIDSIELEKKVADLKKELEKSHEDEKTLQAKIKDLSALQDLPDKVDSLMKQVYVLNEEMCAVQIARESLVSAKAYFKEEAQKLRTFPEQQVKLLDDLSEAKLRENDLTHQ